MSYEKCGRNPRSYLLDVSNERDYEHHTLVDHKALRSRDRCWRSGTFDEINLNAERTAPPWYPHVRLDVVSSFLIQQGEGEVDEIPTARRRGVGYGGVLHGQGFTVRVRGSGRAEEQVLLQGAAPPLLI